MIELLRLKEDSKSMPCEYDSDIEHSREVENMKLLKYYVKN